MVISVIEALRVIPAFIEKFGDALIEVDVSSTGVVIPEHERNHALKSSSGRMLVHIGPTYAKDLKMTQDGITVELRFKDVPSSVCTFPWRAILSTMHSASSKDSTAIRAMIEPPPMPRGRKQPPKLPRDRPDPPSFKRPQLRLIKGGRT